MLAPVCGFGLVGARLGTAFPDRSTHRCEELALRGIAFDALHDAGDAVRMSTECLGRADGGVRSPPRGNRPIAKLAAYRVGRATTSHTRHASSRWQGGCFGARHRPDLLCNSRGGQVGHDSGPQAQPFSVRLCSVSNRVICRESARQIFEARTGASARLSSIRRRCLSSTVTR